MGQWGAFGYAALDHERYQWILAHYYGGTTLSTSDNMVSQDPLVSVELNENDGAPVVVTSPLGVLLRRARVQWRPSRPCRPLRWPLDSLRGRRAASRRDGPASRQASSNPLAEPVLAAAHSRAERQVLTICEADGTALAVRGTVEAYDSPRGAVTLSILPVEEYVRSVISTEVSWSWGLFGGTLGSPQGRPWGFQALEAQAIASRTYVAAEIAAGGWAAYATTCDDQCQSYSGMANENRDLERRRRRHRRTDPRAARCPSARRVLRLHRRLFRSVASFQQSSTAVTRFASRAATTPAIRVTGGWRSVPVRSIEKAFPSVGSPGIGGGDAAQHLGALGGRAETVSSSVPEATRSRSRPTTSNRCSRPTIPVRALLTGSESPTARKTPAAGLPGGRQYGWPCPTTRASCHR